MATSAALIRDGVHRGGRGRTVPAHQQHWAISVGIQLLIVYAKRASASDVDHLAVNQDDHAHFFRKMAFLITAVLGFLGRPRSAQKRRDRQSFRPLAEGISWTKISEACFHAVEHHVAHLASAFYVSPFEEAAVVSLTGLRFFQRRMGRWSWQEPDSQGRVFFLTPGIFYQALTLISGFPITGTNTK